MIKEKEDWAKKVREQTKALLGNRHPDLMKRAEDNLQKELSLPDEEFLARRKADDEQFEKMFEKSKDVVHPEDIF